MSTETSLRPIVIAHLYPREMNLYGDLGNVLTLRRRLEWRGYRVKVISLEVGEKLNLNEVDVVFGGGGQDRGQLLVGPDLIQRGGELRTAAEAGMPMLLVCGLYQLFGRGFRTLQGKDIDGIGVFDAMTIGGSKRMIGNILIDSPFGPIVGFENHSGQTTLGRGQAWLGKVRHGFGNNLQRRHEGALVHNCIGTYMHGPVLPKNPALADHLISIALQRRGITDELVPLDDSVELAAAKVAARRPQ